MCAFLGVATPIVDKRVSCEASIGGWALATRKAGEVRKCKGGESAEGEGEDREGGKVAAPAVETRLNTESDPVHK